MADIVNLRRFRKARLRAEGDSAAERNRMAYGRSKEERSAQGAMAELACRRLDGHRREVTTQDSPDPGGPDG